MDIDHTLKAISIAAIPVLCAITLHEVAHGRVALRFGDRTALMQGRLSLNPLRHVDPIGTVLVPIGLLLLGSPFLFGWAKPVPVDPRYFRHPRADMAWVAAAGPISNLVMAILWTLVGGVAGSAFMGGGVVAEWLFNMATVGLVANVLLAVFNMLPIPPLDGSHVLRSMLPYNALGTYDQFARYGFIVILLLGRFLVPFFMGPANVVVEQGLNFFLRGR